MSEWTFTVCDNCHPNGMMKPLSVSSKGVIAASFKTASKHHGWINKEGLTLCPDCVPKAPEEGVVEIHGASMEMPWITSLVAPPTPDPTPKLDGDPDY